VVVIDGWEHFEDRGNPQFVETSLTASWRDVVAAGPPCGIYVIAVGGQGMLGSRLSSLFGRRLLLPFPNEQTRRTYLTTGVTSPPPLPGRAVEAATGRHVQICVPDGVPETPAVPWHGDRARLPRRFPPLPERLTPSELSAASATSPTWIPLGLGGQDASPLGVDLFEGGPHLLLVSGPPESGRTSAAVAVARALRRVGVEVLAVAPPLSPLRRLLSDDPGVRTVTGTTIGDAELREAVAEFGDRPYAVVVDDVDQITVQPSKEGFIDAPTLLDDIVHPSSLGRQALVVVGDASPILSGQRRSLFRIATEVIAGGIRLLLTPGRPATAKEHGFTLEADQFFGSPPGRGYLARRRSVELIQLVLDAPSTS
jgi:S-DNA-T family DNA segregation ATPase FtsK/SpoIIIE